MSISPDSIRRRLSVNLIPSYVNQSNPLYDAFTDPPKLSLIAFAAALIAYRFPPYSTWLMESATVHVMALSWINASTLPTGMPRAWNVVLFALIAFFSSNFA